MSQTLLQLAADLASGNIQVIDLTIPLGLETQVIALPPCLRRRPA